MLKIKNIRVIDPLNNKDDICDLYIDENGCIQYEGDATEEFDGTGHIAYPGFVDVHVQI